MSINYTNKIYILQNARYFLQDDLNNRFVVSCQTSGRNIFSTGLRTAAVVEEIIPAPHMQLFLS